MGNNLTPVVKYLLGINIGVFALQAILGFDFPEMLGLRYVNATEFRPWQIFTHMFVHSGINHIFGNMLGLFFFGPLLEQFFGPRRFLIFYLACGIGAGLLYSGVIYIEMGSLRDAVQTYIAAPGPDALASFFSKHAEQFYRSQMDFIDAFAENPTSESYIENSRGLVREVYQVISNIPMVGASGAIFGILCGFALLFPNVELFLLFVPFPIKAKYLVTGYGLYTLYSAIARTPGDNVAHYAHLGGMLIAFVLIRYIWKYQRPNIY